MEFINSKKNTSGWNLLLLRKPSPRILQFEGRGIFYKRDIQPRGISAKVPKAADWHFISTYMYTLYI